MIYPEKDLRRVLALLRENPQAIYNGSPCFEYCGSLTEKGYSRPFIGGANRYGHRAIYEAKIGRKLTADEVVMHGCDNRRCCNPEHLILGTIVLNNLDRTAKHRDGKTKVGWSCLKPQEVALIKFYIRENHSTRSILSRFNCSEHALRQIRTGRTWRHIHPADRSEIMECAS